MNARSSLIPTSTEAGYGSTPAALNASSKKQSTTTRSRVVAAVAGVCGVVGVVALRASGVASFAAEGEALTFDKVLSAQVRTRTDRAHGSSVLHAAYALASSRQIRVSRRARTPARGERARASRRASAANAEARPRARARVSATRAPRAARRAPLPRSFDIPTPGGRDEKIVSFSSTPKRSRLTGSRTIFSPTRRFSVRPPLQSFAASLTSACDCFPPTISPRTWLRSTRTARRVSSS